jgi:hypothetical protein
MNTSDHDTPASPADVGLPDLDSDEPDALPSIDVLVAGTLALMTAWADPCAHAPIGPEQVRLLVARKVVSNLFFLQHHPHVRPELRLSVARAHAQWVDLVVRARRATPDTEATGPVSGLGNQCLH